MRHSATRSILSRSDVIVVASVSCIYGIGSPEAYHGMMLLLEEGRELARDEMLRRLVEIQYERNDIDFHRGTFRVRGDLVEIFPAYEEERAIRVEFFGDVIESISVVDPLRGKKLDTLRRTAVYPGSHYVTTQDNLKRAIRDIQEELGVRLDELRRAGKLLEAQRLSARTRFDIEMLQEVGYCPGIENYSRPLSGREPGTPPDTLFSFFPDDFLLFVDESHVTVPQIRGMHHGDHNRKVTLVEHGFRLPSALDNRPLTFDEWEKKIRQVVFVSATPGPYELDKTGGRVVEQVIRPTGLLDPEIEVVPARGQVPHLLAQVRQRASVGERALVTTLTKRLAEDLADYLSKQDVRCKWLHSELDAFERVELLRDLREGQFDVLVGVNLLREGLDLPEVSLVAILDADKEGFLRSETSLIQTIGRSARNVNAKVLLYADTITDSMQRAVEETRRRRKTQEEYNRLHHITPETIRKNIRAGIEAEAAAHASSNAMIGRADESQYITEEFLAELQAEMLSAAEALEFERAAALRDRIQQMRQQLGRRVDEVEIRHATRAERGKRRKSPDRGSSRVPKPKRP